MKISVIYGPQRKFIYQLYVYNDVDDADGDNGDGDDDDMDDLENDDVKTCVAQLVVSQPARERCQRCRNARICNGWTVDG